MNTEPLWLLIDQYRKMADSLEEQVRIITGDLPEVAPPKDRIEAYVVVVRCLTEAASVLDDIADSEARTITRKRAAQARVIANRCTRALENLAKAGEL